MSNVLPLQMLVSCSHGKQVRLTNIAGRFFSGYFNGEILAYFWLSFTRWCWNGRRHCAMFCRYCTCTTFRDGKGARWLTPQLLPSAPPVKQRLVQLHGTKNALYDVTNESSTIEFAADYICRQFVDYGRLIVAPLLSCNYVYRHISIWHSVLYRDNADSKIKNWRELYS